MTDLMIFVLLITISPVLMTISIAVGFIIAIILVGWIVLEKAKMGFQKTTLSV